MADFLGGSEIAARTEVLGMTSQIQQAQVNAKKVENKNSENYMKRLQAVSKEFESIFLSYMMKQMRKTVPESGFFKKSIAKDIFYDMHDDAVAGELAKAGGIGLAALLYKQLSENIPVSKKQINIIK